MQETTITSPPNFNLLNLATHPTPPKKKPGLTIKRYFTTPNDPPIAYVTRTARIVGAGNKVIFEQPNVEAPASWSQLAVNIVAQKYFRGPMGTPERERSIKHLIERVVSTISGWGAKDGYFSGDEDRSVFHDELTHLLVTQRAAFNSPVWFNVGVEDHPQSSACFIQSVDDSMESILDLAKREGMIFKYGSGAGVNLSSIRGKNELLSTGGTASGPLSFMRGFDSFAGAIKSGGRTRRAAKIVILNADHPDIVDFVRSKRTEEEKARILVAAGYDGGIDGDAYQTVAFQNENHSVRVSDDFMRQVEADGPWQLRAVKSGQITETLRARDLFQEMVETAWACGDPGIQFDTTINAWHTCPKSGRIGASNPCQPEFATVLTREGIRTLGEVGVGDEIWSGSRWTRILKKWQTGVKPVYRYFTRAGIFVGTENHRIVSYGEKVEVKDAESIDQCVCQPPEFQAIDRNPRDVFDGLMFGDGSVVHANGGANSYQVLNIGDEDQCYLDPSCEVSGFIDPIPFDIKRHCVAGHSLRSEELPRTYDRVVPERFLKGSLNLVCSFLRGLYSANGSICGGRVTLKASSFAVIEAVQQMLSSVGISSYYTVNRPKEIEFSNGVYTCRQSYDLNITRSRDLFRQLIGFIHPEKNARLDSICKTGKGNHKKTSYEIIDSESLGEFPVFDIMVEAEEHTYWTGGLLVSNCGEFTFLDNSACNLASINLRKFQKDNGDLDAESLRHSVNLLILAQEILVGRSHYPTPEITDNSITFRPLGLGYANLGAFLMARGLPYDSDEARGYASAITAYLHGAANLASSSIASIKGPFDRYAENKEDVRRVLVRHLDKLRTLKDPAPRWLVNDALELWGDVLQSVDAHGIRNAQVTLMAPTGTIAFMMDCDTTGVEPDVSLVKRKVLVGGGTLEYVNGTLDLSLKCLGYDETTRGEIKAFVVTHGTVEGCELVKPDHYPVFDCALPVGPSGRSIDWSGHVNMLAAIQPFISGAISKTVNMPSNATVDEVGRVFMTSWSLGLKSVTIYRNDSKGGQPLSAKGNGHTQTMTIDEVDQILSTRKKLPDERRSVTKKFEIGGFDGYVTAGLYEDGKVGEIFVTSGKEGGTIRGLMDSFASSISIGLQYGVPLESFIRKFSHVSFEPSGFTHDLGHAKSIVDYIFRWLATRFPDGKEAPAALPELPIRAESVKPILHLSSEICATCGQIMRPNGSCHVCETCGATSGCS